MIAFLFQILHHKLSFLKKEEGRGKGGKRRRGKWRGKSRKGRRKGRRRKRYKKRGGEKKRKLRREEEDGGREEEGGGEGSGRETVMTSTRQIPVQNASLYLFRWIDTPAHPR